MANRVAPNKGSDVCVLFAIAGPYVESTGPEGNVVRSALGIACGGGVVAALSTMANAVVFHGAPVAGVPMTLALLLVLMHGLAAIAGGYLAAAIARRRPAAHGFAVGVLYLLAVQFAPATLALVSGAPLSEPIWAATAAMGVTLVGAAAGGGAWGQRVKA
jgi:hypothetical protein